MPFHNFAKIAQFAARDGIEIPRWVALKMEGFLDDAASIRAFGLDVVERLCRRLIDGGAPGLHFYTLNQSGSDDGDLPAVGGLVGVRLPSADRIGPAGHERSRPPDARGRRKRTQPRSYITPSSVSSASSGRSTSVARRNGRKPWV